MKKLLLLLICGSMTAVFLCFKVVEFINTPVKIDNEKIVLIKHGAGLNKIADELYEQGLVGQSWYFTLYCRINELYPKIKAGEYLIDKDISLKGLADLLTSGKVLHRRITFAEGLTVREFADILYGDEYLTDDFITPQEGDVLPETYTYFRGEKRQNIINQAVKSMKKVLQQAWDERDADLPLKSKEEMLILASIVEKETGLASERKLVASVFINRLRKDMLLQTDPTVIYALTEGKRDLGRKLTYKDLDIDSPYNTYKYKGLPPAPICCPGKDSIMAVAHPDKTQYLYFVASGSGGHNFARTLSEHNDNVRKWKALRK